MYERTFKLVFPIIVSCILLSIFIISHLKGMIYFNQFTNDSMKKVEIKIKNRFAEERNMIESIKLISDAKEVNAYKKLFTKSVINKSIKKTKIYNYSVFFKFYTNDSDIYIFHILFDKERVNSRPVYLIKKGRDESDFVGYEFIIKDSIYLLYKKISKYFWKKWKIGYFID